MLIVVTGAVLWLHLNFASHWNEFRDVAGRRADGLESLTLLLRFLGVPVDPAQLRNRFGGVRFGSTEITRCAKDLGLKVRRVQKDWSRLAKTTLPAIAELRDG